VADEKLTPEQQAASDAHTATIAEEQSWGSKVEARLVALEDKTGITKANEKADKADEKEET
jgi:hypothetical protein